MLQFFQNLEQSAGQYDAVSLIAPGLGCMLLGLFTWLGGLEFRKIVIPVAGSLAGGAAGFYLSDGNILISIASTVASAVIAVVLERVFIMLLSIVLAAAAGLTVLTTPYIKETVSFEEILADLPIHNWLIIAVLSVIVIIAGFLLWRLTSALCYATLGTFLIFIGMILLLLYKGAMPASEIADKGSFYLMVFVAMVAFGTVEQLLLCRFRQRKVVIKKESNNN